ncbi:MAG: ornithine carbamoyltransferase [Candidatus Omnitrophota bacterium]
MKKDLITIKELSVEEIEDIFSLATDVKKNKEKFNNSLEGKTLALIFQKPSNRTRVSFEVGIWELGGQAIYLGQDIKLGEREATKDVAMTLSRYVSAVVLRTFSHENILEFARYASIPVINGLSDFSHPCQALSDLFTIKEKFGKIKGLNLAYVGDGNNVCNSLLYASAKTGINLNIATPKKFEPQREVFDEAKRISLTASNAKISLTNKPEEAVKDADIIYTDVWASMGKEKEAKQRIKAFKNFQINRDLVSLAKKSHVIMHCLPAHRNQEITDEIIDGSNSIVFDQAENRLHVQKAILIKLLGEK